MVFEAVVDVLILSGGRRTQVGIVGAIAFHLAMCLFGWAVTIYALIMVPALALLLRAERRAAAVSAATVAASTAADLEVAGRSRPNAWSLDIPCRSMSPDRVTHHHDPVP